MDAVDDPLVSVGAVFFFGFVVLLDHLVQCAHASPKFALDDLIVSPMCRGEGFDVAVGKAVVEHQKLGYKALVVELIDIRLFFTPVHLIGCLSRRHHRLYRFDPIRCLDRVSEWRKKSSVGLRQPDGGSFVFSVLIVVRPHHGVVALLEFTVET